MIPYQRQEQILKLLNAEQFCKYSDLAAQLFVSPATVRRDTREMERKGLVRRVVGGITLVKDPEDVPYDYSVTQNLNKKRILARKAVQMVHAGMSLFVDSSTTTLVFLQELRAIDDLYIVTNGFVPALESAQQPSWHVNLLGGRVNRTLQNVCGDKAIRDTSNYQADLAIFSCRGLTKNGASDANDLEAGIKRAFINNAEKKMLLVDSSKFGTHQIYISAPLANLDYIVSDQPLPPLIQEAASQNNIHVLA